MGFGTSDEQARLQGMISQLENERATLAAERNEAENQRDGLQVRYDLALKRAGETEKALAEAEKRLNAAWIVGYHNRELKFMLKLAKGAIDHAINNEDGLDGVDGHQLTQMIDGKLGMRLVEGEEKARAQAAVCEILKGTKNMGDPELIRALARLKSVEDKGDEYDQGLVERMDTEAQVRDRLAAMASAVDDLLGHGHDYGGPSIACQREGCKGCAAERTLEGMVE